MATRSVYKGSRRKLVLAFDIGTTFSGISYSILDPGQVPEIKGVTRFPANEHISGASKIPTIIYYDAQGKVRAVGAEATCEGILEQAQDGNWTKAEWCVSSHLNIGAGKTLTEHIPNLPPNKTVIEVFADFLRYMLQCAKSYVEDTHANGPDLWASVEDDIDFVLSHPNGWEGTEQTQMRKAIVLSGLIPDTDSGHSRVSFVTEGEASLHYAIQNSVLSTSMKKGNGIVIVDAGGGTIDISSYSDVANSTTNSYEEIAVPQCHFHGAIFVSLLAKVFLEEFLKDSDFVDDVEHIVKCFNETTKPRFRNIEEPQYVKFGSLRDNDPLVNIRIGQLKLAGSEVAKFFEPSINCITTSVLEQCRTSHTKIAHVVLVGGFAANDWVFNSVSKLLSKQDLNVLRPENHVNKAVSDGAISFYLDHFVRSRVSKLAYGTMGARPYAPWDAEHRARQRDLYTSASGQLHNVQVSETKEFRISMVQEARYKMLSSLIMCEVWCYRGMGPPPQWKDLGAANVSHVIQPRIGLTGQTYYEQDFDMVLLFGLTELKAQIAWKENVSEIKGVTRFPANEHISGASKIPTIIYYDAQGKVRAVGAEATCEGILEQAGDGNWTKAEWFKLHLRSKNGAGKTLTEHIPDLPPNKTVIEVFADFLRYMLQCAKSYIEDTHANGPDLWASVEGDIDFVLSHPNGWEGTEQTQMRKAIVLSGLIPDTDSGHSRVSFVTEGEASLHYAIQNSVLSTSMKKGNGIVIVDAGGGTIDISSYIDVANSTTNSYEEIAVPQCHFHGAIFVSVHAKVFLQEFLKDSDFIDDVDHIVNCFNDTTKPRFRNIEEPQYIKFGSLRDNDPLVNIRIGQLKLAGSDVAKFFEPSIKCIVTSVLEQCRTSHTKIAHVVLVGGFAANDWVYKSVSTLLSKPDLNVLRPENHVNKAVSDGAISFYLDHVVRSRVSRLAYGSFSAIRYNPSDREHLARERNVFAMPSGEKFIDDAFIIILPKNVQVSETKEFRRPFKVETWDKTCTPSFVRSVWCYRGTGPPPQWKDLGAGGNFAHLCDISANLSSLPWESQIGSSGQIYYERKIEVVLLFGLTELKAQIAWKENGVEKR
ncbi:hypothetical protein CPC08DRAFT_736124 [Agrocybe pediades]|nr:hypothetical protein CPC08DRAFT_736124 [Agrocybe pediades]